MHRYWPGLAVGLIVGFYWARVIKLVVKARRTSGRAANFLPPELLGRVLRIVWYPTVTLWIIVPMLMALLHRPHGIFQPLYNQPLIAWLGVGLSAVALYLTMICWRKMGKSWRMGIDPAERTQLIFTGPYSYVRHPIYALQCVLAVTTGIAAPSPAMITVVILELIFLQWEARREEKYLVRLHGPDYARYLQSVGRFMPRSLAAYSHHG